MRASAGITWHLLLSLSILFQIVLSDPVDQTASNSAATVTVTPAAGTQLTAGTNGTTPLNNTVNKDKSVDKETKLSTIAPTTVPSTAPTTASTTVAVTIVTPPNPSDKLAPNSTQPTITTITNRTTLPPANQPTGASTVVNNTTAPTATTTPIQNTVTPTAAPKNGGNSSSVIASTSTNAPVVLTTSSIPGGGATGGNTATVGLIHTNGPSQGQTPTPQTPTPSKMTQDSAKGVVVTPKATTTAQSLEWTSAKAAVITGPVPTHNPTGALDNQSKATRPQSTATASATTIASASASATTSAATPKMFNYSLNKGDGKEDKELVEVCKRLMANMENGDCKMKYHHGINGKIQVDGVEISGNVKPTVANQYYEDITKKPTDNKTLIAILASCGALLIMIVILAVCASHHRRPYHENQQHLTEELHTVENGYHDNPTLEVMEVQPEMQEKKMALNGEFNDGWIVPMDNLPKGEIPEEEDTHL